jgi:hypothetical protein
MNDLYHDYLVCWEELIFFWAVCLLWVWHFGDWLVLFEGKGEGWLGGVWGKEMR